MTTTKPCPVKMGDSVTVSKNATEVWEITRLWEEKFQAWPDPQWVARLQGPGMDMSMRVAHLHPVDPSKH